MRRAVPVLVATAGGLVLLANFHTSPEPSGVEVSEAPTSSTATLQRPSVTSTPSTRPASSTSTSTVPSTTTTTPADFVVGPVAHNRWGDVQVRVRLSGARIEDVQAIRLPDSNSHSAALSRESAPRLRLEVLKAQSTEIDVVSGATLTSESYISSLQGALDRAGH